MIKLIVGLANPGDKYTATRHNAGAWYVNLLAKYHYQSLKKESKFYGYTGQFVLVNKNIHLLVPTTFMNLSGKAVSAMAIFYGIVPKEILVAHDELDLLPGYAQLKLGGGHGGHNGLKNIISCLGNNHYFNRLRIGIGHPGDKNKVINFVLSSPTSIEKQLINDTIKQVVCCTNEFILHNTINTINYIRTAVNLTGREY